MTAKITISVRDKILTITSQTKENHIRADENLLKEPPAVYGSIKIEKPDLSKNALASGEMLSGSTSITGRGMAHIFYEVMAKIGAQKIGPLQQEFIQAPENRENKGVLFPHWGNDNLISFDFIPMIRLLYCGEGFTLACMSPERYGVDSKAQIWSLEGIYQRGGGEPFRAKFEFDSMGALIRKIGFYPTGSGGIVSPFELLIEDGDTFEPYVNILSARNVSALGTVSPIMLGGGSLPRWETIIAPVGEYCLGVKTIDFDGAETRNLSDFSILEE